MQSGPFNKLLIIGRNNMNKAILLTFIFVLINVPDAINAVDSPQINARKIALLMVYAKENPPRADAVKQVLQPELPPQSADFTPAQVAIAKTAQKISPTDTAKAQLKEIAEQIDSSDSLLAPEDIANKLNKAAQQAEIIRDSYSYFNPYRYILSNKISSLRDLQKKAAKISAEKAQNYQKEVQKTLKNLISWLK